MGLSMEDWEKEFSKLTDDQARKIADALSTLRECEPIVTHFGSTGLFLLGYGLASGRNFIFTREGVVDL